MLTVVHTILYIRTTEYEIAEHGLYGGEIIVPGLRIAAGLGGEVKCAGCLSFCFVFVAQVRRLC